MAEKRYCPFCGEKPSEITISKGIVSTYEDCSCKVCKKNYEVRFRH